MDKKYTLKNGNMTIMLSGCSGDGKFEFEGLTMDNIQNTIFKKYVWSHEEKKDSEIKSIEIDKYIFDKLKKTADQALKEYIEEHINDIDFYTKLDGNEHSFLNSKMYWKDEYPQEIQHGNLSFSQAGEGIFNLQVNGIICTFDFKQDKFTKFVHEHDYNNSNKITPLYMFYRGNLNLIMAIEQYRKGIAHKTFTEIINLNKFLEGKKSVKLNLKNENGRYGKIVTLKNDRGVDSRSILDVMNNNFYIDNNYNMQPRLEDNKLPISELDFLQFGKKIYKINTENLVLK